MRTLAIDAATRTAGYAVLDSQDGVLKLHAAGRIQLQEGDLPVRLLELYTRVDELVVLHKPDQTAVEDLKMNKFAPNLHSLNMVCMAIGVVLVCFAKSGFQPATLTATTVRSRLAVKKKAGLRAVINQRFKDDILALGYKKLFLQAHEDVTDAIGLAWTASADKTLWKKTEC
jgi:Holliday junction resolvasome RuvABC endonuclease subunit